MLIPGLSWIQVGAGAAAGILLSWGVHTIDVDRIEAANRIAMADMQKQMAAACDADKKLTQEANHALQNNLTATATKLAALKQLHPSACVPVSGLVAGNTGGGLEHAGQNGVSANFDATASGLTSDWLRDYAAECEDYRTEVIVLNNFGLGERAR